MGVWKHMLSGPGFANCYNLRHNTNLDSHEIIKNFPINKKRSKNALKNYVDHLARGLSIVINILRSRHNCFRWWNVKYRFYL